MSWHTTPAGWIEWVEVEEMVVLSVVVKSESRRTLLRCSTVDSSFPQNSDDWR
jgi:hypothetical protein